MKKETPISFSCISGTYTFMGNRIYPRSDQEIHENTKCVYRGYFQTGAPESLRPGEEYILLDIPVNQHTLSEQQLRYPQNRQFWDVADIQGDHLRQILARDNNASRVATELREGRVPSPVGSCKVIEPVYMSLTELQLLTPYEKLLLLEQICQALKELYSCTFHRDKFDAHRDLKPGNILIQRGQGEFTVRLIDFASIHSPNYDGTYGMLISRSNSAPENVCGDNGFEVTSKNDVFALAGYMGLLFGNAHPIYEFNSGFWPAAQDDPEEKSQDLNLAYKRARKMDLDRMPSQPSWLEENLGDAFLWNREPEVIMPDVISLFRQMIRIVPGNRIGINMVQVKLRQMIARMESAGLDQRNLTNEQLYFQQTQRMSDATEFSICLYDRRLLTAHRISYEAATRQVMNTSARSRKKEQVLVFTFGTATEEDTNTDDFAREFGCFRTQSATDIAGALGTLAEANPSLPSILPWTMTALYNRLKKENRMAFTGEIHIFMPDVPEHERFLPCLGEDLKATVKKLRKDFGAKILLHSVTLSETLDLDPWYDDWKGILPPSELFENRQVPKDIVEKGKPTTGRLVDTDEDAWYIEVAGGKQIYIGRRVSYE